MLQLLTQDVTAYRIISIFVDLISVGLSVELGQNTDSNNPLTHLV